MLDVERKEEKVYNQSCINKLCNTSIVIDGKFQEDLDKKNNNIVIRVMSVMKINRSNGEITVKCKRCKTWNKIDLKVKI